MKKILAKKIIFVCFFVIAAILSFLGGISFSMNSQEVEAKEVVIYEDPVILDEDDLYYKDSLIDLDSFVTKQQEVKEEVKVVAEDPNRLKNKLDKEKGVAKATTAAQSVQKYESNETSLGIDVSTWNGKIDWAKVKASGIKFAIIRVGFRGHGSGVITLDNKFYDNMKGAIANDIQVGVYFFTAAVNEEEAIEEAKYVVNLVKDYDISYPIVYDTEMFNNTENYDGYRLKYVSDEQLTMNAIAFCNYVKNAGYTPMIYSSANPLTKRFDTAKFGDTRIWVAQYNDTVTYKGKYHMWQYTSQGSVPGINGRVDMNVAYFSITSDASKQSSVTGVLNNGDLEKVEFIDCYYPSNVINSIGLRSTPYNNLPNKAGTLKSGSSIIVTGINDNWIRIKYNDDIFYVNNTTFYENKDFNGYSEINLDTKTNKKITLLKVPYVNESNVFEEIDVGSDIKIMGTNYKYTKVKYKDNIYYVDDLSEFYDKEVENEIKKDEENNIDNVVNENDNVNNSVEENKD